jgi:CheY-like chemotaxis protein
MITVARAPRPRPARRPPRAKRIEREAPDAPLVLIVDDFEDNRIVYSEFFEHEGMRVDQATDGEHALMKALVIVPDVIVMDLGLPGLDGWEATRELKRHPRTLHIPVVAITGHVTTENLRRARQAGADVVLTKPCRPDTLLAHVLKLLV